MGNGGSEEVEEHFPEAVINSGHDLKDHDTHEVIVEDVKSLDNHIINVYLVAAVKELKAELDAAKASIRQRQFMQIRPIGMKLLH